MLGFGLFIFFNVIFFVHGNGRYACAFVSVKTFVDFEAALGLHGAFWLYAVVSLFGLGFVLVFVPETRGRRLDEMETKPPPLPR